MGSPSSSAALVVPSASADKGQSSGGAGDRDREVDGKALAISLGASLLELGITLTLSYYFSRWLAKKIQGEQGNATDLDFTADNGAEAEGAGGVVGRLQRLLNKRHAATRQALLDELEEYQSQSDQEEKKDDSTAGGEEVALRALQYEKLTDELHLQHQHSMSALGTLSPYEMNVAQSNVIDPANIAVKFGDVGGMDDIKSEIYDLVVLPLLRPDLFTSDSGLVSPPKGILLYGPPGTGKTMLAKAIAKESHATFVNVQLSTIMNKWFGESNKLISATFQLARKLAPSVIFIDEIDAFLSQRDGTEGSAVNSMKSEFLTLWDGLLSERRKVKRPTVAVESDEGWFGRGEAQSDEDAEEEVLLPTPPIIVLGATNRPYDIDAAILRRLPRSFEISLPSYESRLQLLELFLEKQNMTAEARGFLPTVAKQTEGYSGSDLKELCKAAAWEPVREMTAGASRQATTGTKLKRSASGFPARGTKARPVGPNDFVQAIKKVKKTGESARQFGKKEFLRGREDRAATGAEIRREINRASAAAVQDEAPGNTTIDMQQLMALAMQAASAMQTNQPREGTTAGRSGDDNPPEM